MPISDSDPSNDPHIELVALASNAWRISDARLADGDPRRILGYLEQQDGTVEIMWMRPEAGACEYFTSLAEALAAAGARIAHGSEAGV